ncbi:MAG: F0F1 ATP synthase subunit delta [Propionibacteriaceae bacterium]|jgi:F-type H+-transporting ATPase subunit delta|nr:F0F1 ATP synthase subunit delta [Propionibacteriaceae bacterium]
MAVALSSAQALDDALTAVAGDGQTAQELLAAAGLLDRDPFLRRALSDPAAPSEARRQVAGALFRGRLSAAALSLLQTAAGQSWPDGLALARALERQGVRAVWLWAQAVGNLDRVMDELFTAGRLISQDPELRRAVTDAAAAAAPRRELVRRLLAGRVEPQTLVLAEHAALNGHATFEDVVRRDLAQAGRLRGVEVAVATSARPLSESQRVRLAAALTARAGRPVALEEVVDPAVVGGVKVELGDEVIDGTLTARLGAARRHLT